MEQFEPLSEHIEQIASAIFQSALAVHRGLGPGLLESVYEVCLVHELKQRGLAVQSQLVLPIRYSGVTLDAGLRLDALVEGKVIVELKAVEKILPIHRAQVLTYLKLTNLRLGMLINFNVPVIKDGIKRVIL